MKKVTFISQLFPIIAWLPTDIRKLNKTYIIFATTEINARYILSPMEFELIILYLFRYKFQKLYRFHYILSKYGQ